MKDSRPPNDIRDLIRRGIQKAEDGDRDWMTEEEVVGNIPTPHLPQQPSSVDNAELVNIVSAAKEVDLVSLHKLLSPLVKEKYGFTGRIYVDHIKFRAVFDKGVGIIYLKLILAGIAVGHEGPSYLVQSDVEYVPKSCGTILFTHVQKIRTWIQIRANELLKAMADMESPIPLDDIEDLRSILKQVIGPDNVDVCFITDTGLHKNPLNPAIEPQIRYRKVGMTRGGRQRMNYEIKNGYSQEIFGDIALQAALFYYESLGFTVKVTGIHKKDLVTHKKKVTTAMNEHSADIMRRYKKVIDGEAKKKIIVPDR